MDGCTGFEATTLRVDQKVLRFNILYKVNVNTHWNSSRRANSVAWRWQESRLRKDKKEEAPDLVALHCLAI